MLVYINYWELAFSAFFWERKVTEGRGLVLTHVWDPCLTLAGGQRGCVVQLWGA